MAKTAEETAAQVTQAMKEVRFLASDLKAASDELRAFKTPITDVRHRSDFRASNWCHARGHLENH
jgi:xanthine dehydrogenase iron-sulfur cluster and FAD-binding subunit A